mmetsp:Transcript_12386/g.13558  ORF Transcript_12386/g.13558 Transcript_12386/m.13558 type:complete len:212 (+) Transcript_12386:388-1023(+)
MFVSGVKSIEPAWGVSKTFSSQIRLFSQRLMLFSDSSAVVVVVWLFRWRFLGLGLDRGVSSASRTSGRSSTTSTDCLPGFFISLGLILLIFNSMLCIKLPSPSSLSDSSAGNLIASFSFKYLLRNNAPEKASRFDSEIIVEEKFSQAKLPLLLAVKSGSKFSESSVARFVSKSGNVFNSSSKSAKYKNGRASRDLLVSSPVFSLSYNNWFT